MIAPSSATTRRVMLKPAEKKRITVTPLQTLSICAAIGLLITQAAADPLDTLDDVIQSMAVLDACHVAIPWPATDRKFKSLGDAAYQEILQGLDNPNDQETIEKADFLLKKRTEEGMRHGQTLATEKGCAIAAPHARDVMESFRQAK